MAAADLNYFQIDCKKKEQQIRMLQSMRQTPDEQVSASFGNMLQPWKVITDPSVFQQRAEIGSGAINWQINYNLHLLSSCS